MNRNWKIKLTLFCFKVHKTCKYFYFLFPSILFDNEKHKFPFCSRFVAIIKTRKSILSYRSLSDINCNIRDENNSESIKRMLTIRLSSGNKTCRKTVRSFLIFLRVYSFINKWKFYFSDREKFYFPDALHKAFGFSIDIYHVDVTLSYKEKNTYLRYENSPRVCNTQHNLFNWKDLIFMIMDHEFLKKYINVCKKIR